MTTYSEEDCPSPNDCNDLYHHHKPEAKQSLKSIVVLGAALYHVSLIDHENKGMQASTDAAATVIDETVAAIEHYYQMRNE